MSGNFAYFLVVLLFAMGACQSGHEEEPVYEAFNTDDYVIEKQNNRIERYLRSKGLFTDGKETHFFFIQTEDCAKCVLNKNLELNPYFSKTHVRTIVLINDSSIIPEKTNPTIQYVWISSEELKREKVFHDFPWLYAYNGRQLTDLKLTSPVCDSLLNSVK